MKKQSSSRYFKGLPHKLCILILGMVFLQNGSMAQTNENSSGPQSSEEMSKKLNNPVASLISVPFQSNTDIGIGKYNGVRNTLNFQPVIPIVLSPDLNLIARVIAPIISQRDINGEHTSQTGLADVVASAFFSPSHTSNGLTWGAGPVFLVPVATNDLLATKKFGVGPTAVVLEQTKGWTFGALANQIWSVTGDKDRANVSQGYLQPFLNYNWKSGAGLGISSEIAQNWETSTTTAFIIPSISGITKLGQQIVQLNVGPRIQIACGEGEKSDFGVRASVVLVFPR
jgi:hypothetical protein